MVCVLCVFVVVGLLVLPWQLREVSSMHDCVCWRTLKLEVESSNVVVIYLTKANS